LQIASRTDNSVTLPHLDCRSCHDHEHQAVSEIGLISEVPLGDTEIQGPENGMRGKERPLVRSFASCLQTTPADDSLAQEWKKLLLHGMSVIGIGM